MLVRPAGRTAIAGIFGALRGKVAQILITFAASIAAVVAVAYVLGRVGD